MRIAVIGVRGIPHTYGGGEEAIYHLCPLLVSKGYDVIVYCRRGLFRDRSRNYKGVRRIFLPTIEHKWLGLLIHATLAYLDLLFRGVDIVYVYALPSGILTIIPWLFRKKIVVNVDGLDWERGKWGFVARFYLKLSARVVMFTATEIVSDAKEIQRYYNQNFNKNSSFIANGAEIDTSSDPAVVSQYGLEPGEYYLIASRIVPENNADLIIDAFSRVETDRTLVVAGSANYEDSWTRKLKEIAGARVRFLGHVSDRKHVAELHRNCYAYIHGHSLGGINPSLLKALGYGNCVLALDTPYNMEVLNGDDGIIYGIPFKRDTDDLARKIMAIDADPKRAAAFREIAPKRIEEAYTWDRITNQYAALFERITK